MTTVLMDTHVVVWWSGEPERLSAPAVQAITAADDLAVAAITWFELARLAAKGVVTAQPSLSSWLQSLASTLRTIAISPAIGEKAAVLPAPFPGDPVDRLIYATAIEHGYQLVTKDQRLRDHPHTRPITVW